MPDKPKRLLRLPQVRDRTGYSTASVWRLVKAGKLPQPVKLFGGRAVGWIESEIDAAIESRIAAHDAAEAR